MNSQIAPLDVGVFTVVREQLHRDGYAVVPSLLEAERIERLREVCAAAYRDNLGPGHGEIFPSQVLKTPEIATVIFGEKTVEALAAILGGAYLVFPSFHVKGNTYVGWHTDHAFRTVNRADPHSDFLQCAIYLQPSIPWGGLEVLPGTHWGRTAEDHYDNLVKRVVEVDVERLPPGKRVDHSAGDLVVWDARLGHRSSARSDSAPDGRKFGIHWTVARHGAAVDEVWSRLRGRTGNYVDGRLVENERFLDMRSVTFPASFSQHVQQTIRRYELGIVS